MQGGLHLQLQPNIIYISAYRHNPCIQHRNRMSIHHQRKTAQLMHSPDADDLLTMTPTNRKMMPMIISMLNYITHIYPMQYQVLLLESIFTKGNMKGTTLLSDIILKPYRDRQSNRSTISAITEEVSKFPRTRRLPVQTRTQTKRPPTTSSRITCSTTRNPSTITWRSWASSPKRDVRPCLSTISMEGNVR